MSKDKGTKNIKKAPADKSKAKVVSDYKAENKSSGSSGLKTFSPKADSKNASKKS